MATESGSIPTTTTATLPGIGSGGAPAVSVRRPICTRIVAHNVVHMRREPASGSEMVSQTLMGRPAQVLETHGLWSYVETDDTYRGWVESRWLAEPVQGRTLTPITTVFAELRESPRAGAPLILRLPILASLHVKPRHSVREEWVDAMLPDGETLGWLPAAAVAPPPTPSIPPEMMAQVAAEKGRDFLGTPYLWGGSSSFGLDCSGFVQLCYRLAGLTLRRDADIQRDDPRFVPVRDFEREPGDLVFFGRGDKITHVGMQFTGSTFIHSAGGAGVIVTEWGDDRYSQSYIDARRLDPARAADPVTRFEGEDR